MAHLPSRSQLLPRPAAPAPARVASHQASAPAPIPAGGQRLVRPIDNGYIVTTTDKNYRTVSETYTEKAP